MAALLSLFAGGKAASAEQKAGYAEQEQAMAQAKAKELDAKNSVAMKQREAHEEMRQARVLASRALALAAAGGGNASDITVMNLIADIDSEGIYRAQVAMYEGEAQAQMYNLEADSLKKYGQSRKEAGKARAEARWLSSFGSMYSQYG